MVEHLRIHLDERAVYETTEPSSALSRYLQEIMIQQMTHLDLMAAAYLKQTSIDPARVVLIEQREDTRTLWYFAERQPDGTLKLPDSQA